MTEPLTTTELLAMADRLEAEAKRLQAKAAEIRSTVATIEAIRATGPSESFLPSGEQSDTIGTMNTSDIDTRPAVPGRKFTTKHPLPMRAKALKLSIGDIAEQLSAALKRPIPRTSVRSWYAPKGNVAARPIPDDAVEFFESAPWSIPRSAWKNGVSE